jgi:hypothetical protein
MRTLIEDQDFQALYGALGNIAPKLQDPKFLVELLAYVSDVAVQDRILSLIKEADAESIKILRLLLNPDYYPVLVRSFKNLTLEALNEPDYWTVLAEICDKVAKLKSQDVIGTILDFMSEDNSPVHEIVDLLRTEAVRAVEPQTDSTLLFKKPIELPLDGVMTKFRTTRDIFPDETVQESAGKDTSHAYLKLDTLLRSIRGGQALTRALCEYMIKDPVERGKFRNGAMLKGVGPIFRELLMYMSEKYFAEMQPKGTVISTIMDLSVKLFELRQSRIEAYTKIMIKLRGGNQFDESLKVITEVNL